MKNITETIFMFIYTIFAFIGMVLSWTKYLFFWVIVKGDQIAREEEIAKTTKALKIAKYLYEANPTDERHQKLLYAEDAHSIATGRFSA